LFGIFLINVL